MNFRSFSISGIVSKSSIPEDINLELPDNSSLPLDQQHYLLYIPWDDRLVQKIPTEYRDFFIKALPHLKVRTTDVHTAISLSFLDELLQKFPKDFVNRRVLALSLILHDSGWSMLSEAEITDSLGVTGLKLSEKAIAPKEKHAIKSEEIARKILSEYDFDPELMKDEIDLISKAIRYHDRPEEVAGVDSEMPIEVKLLVDLDHLWSFTHQNFWQDTVRKGVNARKYFDNLTRDLDSYFVTEEGKELARELLAQREDELEEWEKLG